MINCVLYRFPSLGSKQGQQPERDETSHELGGTVQWKPGECQGVKGVEMSMSCSGSGNLRRLPGGRVCCRLLRMMSKAEGTARPRKHEALRREHL